LKTSKFCSSVSIWGISKVIFFYRAARKSYFGNEIIRDDSELNAIMEEVNAVKPRVTILFIGISNFWLLSTYLASISGTEAKRNVWQF